MTFDIDRVVALTNSTQLTSQKIRNITVTLFLKFNQDCPIAIWSRSQAGSTVAQAICVCEKVHCIELNFLKKFVIYHKETLRTNMKPRFDSAINCLNGEQCPCCNKIKHENNAFIYG